MSLLVLLNLLPEKSLQSDRNGNKGHDRLEGSLSFHWCTHVRKSDEGTNIAWPNCKQINLKKQSPDKIMFKTSPDSLFTIH